MENKRRFANEIAARLAAAPESDAKSEMIEELAENLARRYEDMTAAGMGEEEAFARAMEELGDVEELTAYLESLEPEAAPKSGMPEGMDELFQTLGDMGRTMGEMAREAARRARDFARSDAVRGAAQEAKRAAHEAKEFIKAETAPLWSGKDERVFVNDADGATGGAGVLEKSIPSQNVLALDIETAGGDVDLRVDGDGEAPVRVRSNSDRLEVSLTGEGVLTVRERPTASELFFSQRGLSSADVELTVPARRWDSIRITTASGDVELRGELETGALGVRTASGDLEGSLRTCGTLEFKSASGDMELRGHVERLRAETVSGDVELEGSVGEAAVNTVSGDIELRGTAGRVRASAMSGDILVKSMALPRQLDLRSKSGDVEAAIPDSGPFRVRLNTVSGEVDYRFPREWNAGGEKPEEGVPDYSLASTSGDVTLRKA